MDVSIAVPITQQQDVCDEENDVNSSENDDDEEMRSASSAVVKKEHSEVKSEVMAEVTNMPAKKRKRNNADHDDGCEDETGNHLGTSNFTSIFAAFFELISLLVYSILVQVCSHCL
jgi:hypothetical protein